MFVRGLAERDEQKMEPQSLYLDTPTTAEPVSGYTNHCSPRMRARARI